MRASLAAATDKCRAFEEASRASAQKESRLTHAMQVEAEAKQVQQREFNALKEAHDSLAGLLNSTRAEVAEAANVIRSMKAESVSLQRSLASTEQDFLQLAAVKAEDAKRAEARVAAVREESAQQEQQFRLREQDLEEVVRGLNAQIAEHKRNADDSLAKHTQQVESLNGLLQKASSELALQRRSSAEARETADRRLQEATAKWSSELGEVSGERAALLAGREEALAHAHAHAGALEAFKHRHVQIVSALQTALRQIRSDYESSMTSQSKITLLARALTNQASKASADAQRPLDGWHAATKSTISDLNRKLADVDAQRENALDQLTAVQLQYEEERAKGIMLLEEVDKAEHETAQLAGRMRDAEAKANERADRLNRELRTSEESRGEQSAQVQRLKAALDKANEHAVNLQADHHALARECDDVTAKAAAKVHDAEAYAASCDAEIRAMRAGIEAMQQERSRLQASFDDVTKQLRGAQSRAQELEAALKSVSGSEKAKLQSLSKQVTSLTDSVGKMSTQLQATQGLLSVTQAQRVALEEENRTMKTELAEAYSKRLGGASFAK